MMNPDYVRDICRLVRRTLGRPGARDGWAPVFSPGLLDYMQRQAGPHIDTDEESPPPTYQVGSEERIGSGWVRLNTKGEDFLMRFPWLH